MKVRRSGSCCIGKAAITPRWSSQRFARGDIAISRTSDIVDIVRTLARIEPDARIAAILNRNRTPYRTRTDLDGERVCSLRNNHAIAVYREGERQARGEMSVSEVAGILGVTPTTVLRLIRLKQLPATQACVSAPWIVLASDVEQFVAARNHRATPPPLDSPQLILDIP